MRSRWLLHLWFRYLWDDVQLISGCATALTGVERGDLHVRPAPTSAATVRSSFPERRPNSLSKPNPKQLMPQPIEAMWKPYNMHTPACEMTPTTLQSAGQVRTSVIRQKGFTSDPRCKAFLTAHWAARTNKMMYSSLAVSPQSAPLKPALRPLLPSSLRRPRAWRSPREWPTQGKVVAPGPSNEKRKKFFRKICGEVSRRSNSMDSEFGILSCRFF